NPATTDAVVSVDGVWKLFAMGDDVVRALIDVSFTVEPGEFVCLMGPSGSGKSTLLHLLGGLDRPTRGEVSIAGEPTSGLTESQFSALRHSTIGFIFQSYNLMPFLTAVENVELPLMFEPVDRASVRRRAVDLLELVGLGHRLDHRPSRVSGGGEAGGGRREPPPHTPAAAEGGRRAAAAGHRPAPHRVAPGDPRRRADRQPRPQ